MSEFRTFHEGAPRAPTWIERKRYELLREEGVEGIYVEPEEAPNEFWTALVMLTRWHLASADSSIWQEWTDEMIFNGLTLLDKKGFPAFNQVVGIGRSEQSTYLGSGPPEFVSTEARISAVEHLWIS